MKKFFYALVSLIFLFSLLNADYTARFKLSDNYLLENSSFYVKNWVSFNHFNLANGQYFSYAYKPFSTQILMYGDNIFFFTYYLPNAYIDYPVEVYSLNNYSKKLTNNTFKKFHIQKVNLFFSNGAVVSGTNSASNASNNEGLIPDINLPIEMPKPLQKILGRRAGGLKISGSQTITIGGESSWTIGGSEADQENNSKWPSPEMKQKLNVKLQGTVGEKVHVDIYHNSEQTGFGQKNKIKIWYKGDEDEIIQSIEAGETQLSLSGSKFVNGSFASHGLFGIKSNLQIGNLKTTLIMSKQEGATASNTVRPSGGLLSENTFYDKDYIKNKYFFLGHTNIQTIKVYIDDGNGNNNDQTGALPGIAVDPTDTSVTHSGYFNLLEMNKDYTIELTSGNDGILKMKNMVSSSYVLAVAYTTYDGIVVGNTNNPDSLILQLEKPANQTAPTSYDPNGSQLWFWNLKNYYSIGSTDVSPENFEIIIRKEGTSGDANSDIDEATHKTYINLLGLDKDNDGKIDDDYIDYANGLIIFPPNTDPYPTANFPFAYSGLGDNANNNIYYKTDLGPSDIKFEIYVKYTGQGGKVIQLNTWDIVEGSEIVKLDGQTLQRGKDYTIDYQSGVLTIINSSLAYTEGNLEITYEYTPLFAMGQKTVIGMRNDLQLGNLKLGSTTIYMTESAPNSGPPQIGKEPNATLLTDIDASANFELPFLTKAVDWLPMIETDKKSSITFKGEIGISVPNPNIKGSAWLDNMESIAEATPLSISYRSWDMRSIPIGKTLDERGTFYWYNPENGVKKGDIYPDNYLSETEKNKTIQVVVFQNTTENTSDSTWIGIMSALGKTGADFSQKKELRILVKGNAGHLHIDFGDISENFYRPDIDHYDSEESLKPDSTYNADGKLGPDEDTGFDRLFSEDEPGYNASTNPDPNGDDYKSYENTQSYTKVNNRENNGRLDTEDLNANGIMDTKNEYFEMDVDLTVTETDEYEVTNYLNDWKLITIPLSKFDMVGFNDVNKWQLVKYCSIWFDNLSNEQSVMIGGIDVIGNKWDAMVRSLNGSETDTIETKVKTTVVNNKDNPDYSPPPDVDLSKDSEGNIPKEQTLVLEYENLHLNSEALVYESYFATSYMIYNKIKLWVKNKNSTYQHTYIPFFIRLGTDTTAYYEYVDTIGSDWTKIEINISDLVITKQLSLNNTDTTLVDENGVFTNPNNAKFKVKGKPTFTGIKRVEIGVINDGDSDIDGSFYVDNIELIDVKRDIGKAMEASTTITFADVGKVSMSYNYNDENFHSLNAKEGDGKIDQVINVNGSWQLHRFMPANWKISLPINLTWKKAEQRSKFQPNSDLLAIPGQDKSYSDSWSLGTSFQRTGADDDPWYLAYTINKMKLSYNQSESNAESYSQKAHSSTYKGSLTYSLNSSENNKIHLFKGVYFYYLPKTVTVSTTGSYAKSKTSKRSGDVWVPTNSLTKTASASSSITYQFFKSLSSNFNIQTTRDLMKKNIFYGINIGKETNFKHNTAINYNMNFLPILKPNLSFSTQYTETPKNDTLNTFAQNNSIKINGSTSLTEISDAIWNGGKWVVKGVGSLFKGTSEDTVKTKTKKKIVSPSTTVNDKKNKKGLLSKIGEYYKIALTRLGKINLMASRAKDCSYKDVKLYPSLKFQFGIISDVGEGWSSKKMTDNYSVSTNLKIYSQLSTNLKYVYKINYNYSPGNQTKQISISYPGVSLSWKSLEKLPVLKYIAKSSSISTAYNQSVTSSSTLTDTSSVLKSEGFAYKFQPFLSWKIFWKWGFSTNFTFNYAKGYARNYESYSKTEEENKDFSSALSYSFSAPKGINVPLFGQIKFNSTLNIGISYKIKWSYKKNYNLRDGSEQVQTDQATWSLTPNLSYQFSKNITGGMDVSISTTTDYASANNKGTRKVGVHFNVIFKF